MKGVWAAAFLLRRLRAERGVVLLLVALVAITSFLGAAAPRLYNLVADAGLRREVAAAGPSRRNIELVQEFVMPPGEEPADLVDRLGRTYFSLMGDSVQAMVASDEVVATSPRFGLRQPPRYTTYVSLRHQTGLGEAVQLTQGRWPASTGERLPAAALEFGPPAEEPPLEPPRIEIALSRTTAEESGLTLGTIYEAAVDSADPLLPRALVRPLVARLEVVGIFDIADPRADIWYADNRLQRVGADFNADTPILFATALIAPEAHPDLVTSNLPFRYQWHYFIDPDRLDAGQPRHRHPGAQPARDDVHHLHVRGGRPGADHPAERPPHRHRPLPGPAGRLGGGPVGRGDRAAGARRGRDRHARDPAHQPAARRAAPGPRPRGSDGA